MDSRRWTTLGALLAGVAVLLGAFGAHALAETLEARGSTHTWDTAVHYLGGHALALVLYGLFRRGNAGPAPAAAVGWLFLAGAACFSGSLFALSLGGPRWLGPVTPLGGLMLLAGWALFAREAWRKS